MVDDRRLDVLRAIVEDYVATQEPVGSRALADRHNLGVSPATIRNDMAALEEEGLIAQPHTSAGRVPTDKGYRLFVDEVGQIKPLSVPEKRAITTLMEGATDLDEVLERTVRVLAQLTRQVAVVQYPSLHQAQVRHIEFVPMAPDRVMIVLITDSGRVDQHTIEISEPPSDEFIFGLRTRLNSATFGRRVTELEPILGDVLAAYSEIDRPLAGELIRGVADVLDSRKEERIILAGTANLARAGTDFTQTMEPVLDAIEEQMVLLRLLSDIASEPGQVAVRIGHEMPNASLSSTSVVSTAYGTVDPGSTVSKMAVLGPTRMDYVGSMSAVWAVARYVSRFLN